MICSLTCAVSAPLFELCVRTKFVYHLSIVATCHVIHVHGCACACNGHTMSCKSDRTYSLSLMHSCMNDQQVDKDHVRFLPRDEVFQGNVGFLRLSLARSASTVAITLGVSGAP